MPARARLWLAGVIACVAALSPAHGDPAPSVDKLWLVQVMYDGLPADADPDADPGRVEVSIAGRFVGCAWASWFRPELTEVRLVPITLGFSTTGKREDIKVQSYGELARLGRQSVRITEVGAPRIGVP